MHTSVLILALLALVLQAATKHIDLNAINSIESKPAGMVPNVTARAHWELVDSTLPNYCGIKLIIRANSSAEPATHQLYVAATDKLFIGSLTIIKNEAYARFCMAVKYGGPPEACSSPVKLYLLDDEAIVFAVTFRLPKQDRDRGHYNVTAAVATSHQEVEMHFDTSFNATKGEMHVLTAHEIEGTPLPGQTLLNAVVHATTQGSKRLCYPRAMRPTTVEVQAYLAPTISKIDCRSEWTDALILRMADTEARSQS
ncbi:hypothetical protein RI367_007931 [Sorochytrium milnesiophthora]